jgi:hypothetical protein
VPKRNLDCLFATMTDERKDAGDGIEEITLTGQESYHSARKVQMGQAMQD